VNTDRSAAILLGTWFVSKKRKERNWNFGDDWPRGGGGRGCRARL